MRKLNKKGFLEAGVIGVMGTILAVVGLSGTLFSTGQPVGSIFLVTNAAFVSYSQSQHVKDHFRRDKAVEICSNEVGVAPEYCANKVALMTDEAVLDFIRDDVEIVANNNNGNFLAGMMQY